MKLYISVTPIKVSKGWWRKKHYWDVQDITVTSEKAPEHYSVTIHNRKYHKRGYPLLYPSEILQHIRGVFNIMPYDHIEFTYAGQIGNVGNQIAAVETLLCNDASFLEDLCPFVSHSNVYHRLLNLVKMMPDECFGIASDFSLVLDKEPDSPYTLEQKLEMLHTHEDCPDMASTGVHNVVFWSRQMDKFLDKIQNGIINEKSYNKTGA